MSMQVLVTSDTHLELGAKLPTQLLELAQRADHVVHAGDAVTSDVLETLGTLAPLTAVHGNVDYVATRHRLPERATLELAGVQIGVVHDPGPERGRLERLRGWFPDCVVIVYGHTHQPMVEHAPDGGPLVINPGSPTQRRRAHTHTACWLELDGGAVVAVDLVDLDAANPRSSAARQPT